MMTWITIDQEKCTLCGMCESLCMADCFSEEESAMSSNADADTCILCGHCVAMCPEDAIEHHKMDTNNFVEYDEKAVIDTDSFIQFIRERRSHRFYRDKPVSREKLEKLVDVCRYAPTGGNDQTAEITVTQDREKIKRYSDLIADFLMIISEPARQRMGALEAEGKQDTGEYELSKKLLRMSEKCDQTRKSGGDRVLYNAPAVMMFHAVSDSPGAKDNCVIASTTVALMARTMGLEFCYLGLMDYTAARNYPPLIEALPLPHNHQVFSTIVLGYPEYDFRKAVDRKPIEVRWE